MDLKAFQQRILMGRYARGLLNPIKQSLVREPTQKVVEGMSVQVDASSRC